MFNSTTSHGLYTLYMYTTAIQKICAHTITKVKFLFRKMRASTLLGLRLIRNLLTVRPAFENILSDGFDVAGMCSKL